MKVRMSVLLVVIAFVTALPGVACGQSKKTKPNILVIVADDLGYADTGFQGCTDIPTPNLDKLAGRSLRCTNGYVTHPFCSPTRACLLTGRYQQRFGHENNPAWLPEDPTVGLPLSQTTLPQVLHTAEYRTGCVGKWHLGAHPSFHPNKRGFDDYFGLLGGGHMYLPQQKGSAEYTIPLDRNGKKENLTEYLTDVLGREGADYIRRNKEDPWFLYLAFNAPHTPLQSTKNYLERVKNISNETRRKYASLIVGMDDAIGVVLDALHESGQENDTVVWFFSDNGGPVSVTNSNNSPLRGAKGSIFEGGVRVPFLISWPAQLPGGKDYSQPVSSLDVFATSAAIANAQVPENHKLEGVNLLPFIKGGNSNAPHDRLFWRTGGGKSWAVREGDWKLAVPAEGKALLFNLKDDISESKDVGDRNPEVIARLKTAYDAWNRGNVDPLFESPQPAKKK
ncbi:MAG: sulfatase-like hydrolase/transferase [Pirellulales bacterium]